MIAVYKRIMVTKIAAIRYNIEPRTISIREMLKIFEKFMGETEAYLDELGIEKEVRSYIANRKPYYKCIFVIRCMRDYVMRFIRFLQRIFVRCLGRKS